MGSHLAGPGGFRIDPEALGRLNPEERERVLEELQVLEGAYKANPLLGYHPHGKQVVFHSPDVWGFPPLRAFFGGNRSGKTTAAIVDTIIQLVDRDVLPSHLTAFKRWDAPAKIRIVTPDLTSTMDGVVHEKFREWCPKAQFKGGSFDRAFDKVQRMLHFKNGSWVQFNSSEQDREKLGGVALHRVVYDEEPRQEVRRECLTRLIDFDGEEIFALTPFSGMAWLFDEVYDPWERGELDPKDGRVVVVDMDDNPHLSESGKARALAQYSGPEREARKSGRFVSFSGRIYPQFSEEKHLIPSLSRLPANVEVFRGIDPGIRHMCAVVYCYLDENDEMVVFDEIALRDVTVKQICRAMEERDAKWGAAREDGTIAPLRVNWSAIDPASKNRNNQTGRSDQQEFWDNGVSTIPGQNAVTAGINRVKERLDADRLKITADCPVLRQQFVRYRWTKDDGRTEHEAKETPVKKDDHLLDALRYVVMQRPLLPVVKVEKPSDTFKDRALRAALKRLKVPAYPTHDSGPGIYQ